MNNNFLTNLNKQFESQASAKRSQPTLDVWASMGLDKKLRPEIVQKRLATRKLMDDNYDRINEHVVSSEFPFWIVPEISKLGIAGLEIKTHGGPGMSNVEIGSIIYELAKKDASLTTFVLVHGAIGHSVVNTLGNQEMKDRVLPDSIKLNKICAFGLTEPNNGSDASNLKTTARKVEGGYLLNGQKRWIGNGTFADYIMMWARNTADKNQIQAFMVTKGSKGLKTTKIENKYSLRIVQNADIEMNDVFVPDHNKVEFATNFQSGTNAVLEPSRLCVGWIAVGIAVGAYEAALKYALTRKQFGKVIAKFQLTQEKLSRMLGLCEMMISNTLFVSEQMDQGLATIGLVGRTKATNSKLAREVCQLAREMCGGNGIILDNHVMKCLMDIEAIHTYEGTYEVNSLVSGREITGGISAFK